MKTIFVLQVEDWCGGCGKFRILKKHLGKWWCRGCRKKPIEVFQ